MLSVNVKGTKEFSKTRAIAFSLAEETWFKVKYYLMKLAYFNKRSRLKRYSFPVILITLLFSLIIFIPINFFQLINSETLSFLIFAFIVIASSWYGGLGPGIFATLLTAVVNYLTLLQYDAPFHSAAGDLTVTLAYLVFGFIISIISEARYEAELQKDEFLGLITHELKNPLSVIKGFNGLLENYAKKSEHQKIVKYTQQINSQSDKLIELINDLLDVNKLEVGKFVYHYEFFYFEDLVKEILNHQKIVNKKRKILFSGSSGTIIEGDRYRIGQVITNLLTNALKYSDDKKPVRVNIKQGNKKIKLSVRDYGAGISKLEQRQIFNQYYRTRNALRGRTEGLGLGLFICKSIIDRHKGQLLLNSTEGKGSVFSFTLPLGRRNPGHI